MNRLQLGFPSEFTPPPQACHVWKWRDDAMRRLSGILIAVLLGSAGASAAVDKYNITPEEHAACDQDALFYCAGSLDEDQLLACMKANIHKLTSDCSATFISGLKRRHLAF